MRALVILSLICCVVVVMTAPVTAGDYLFCKEVNADDFTDALVDYCNGNTVHEVTGYGLKLSNHDCMIYNISQTNDTLDFRFHAEGRYCTLVLICFPFPWFYSFDGEMHVDNPQDGLKTPYTLSIFSDNDGFTAEGDNWLLNVRNKHTTCFKVVVRAP